jgi:hypothetical protein
VDRDLSLALWALASLLEAQVPAAEALAAVATRLPAGAPTAEALRQAAARTKDGADPARALGEALPALAPLLGSGAELPERLRGAARRSAHAHRLSLRLAVVASYPLFIALGVAGITLAVLVANLAALGLHASWGGEGGRGPLLAAGVTAVAGVAFLADAWVQLRQGRAPFWVRFVPGGGAFEQLARAGRAADYAVARDPGLGGQDPFQATGQATGLTVERALVTVFGTADAAELALGEAAGRPSQAARALALRLEDEAAEHAERFVSAAALVLLLLAGLGVALLALTVFPSVLEMGRGLP